MASFLFEVESVIAGRHRDPHQVLGFHGGSVVAYRPGAQAMQVLLASGDEIGSPSWVRTLASRSSHRRRDMAADP